MKTVLITGVGGFIGYNLALRLIKKYKVIGIDNLNNSSSKKLKKARIKKLNHRNFLFLKKDILNLKQQIDADYVYHLAAVKLNDTKDNAKLIYKNNILATLKLIKLLNKERLKKVIFSSSLYVYGNFNKIKSENDKCQPENNYGKSKLKGEQILINKFYKQRKIDLTIFRIFFTYGDNQYSTNTGYPSVIYKNLLRLTKKKKPLIYNDGEQILDYSHINYVAKVLQKPLTSKINGIYNLCSGKSVKIIDLVMKMKKLFKKSKEPIFAGWDNTANTIKLGNNQKLFKKMRIKEGRLNLKKLKNIKDNFIYAR
tara:strand:+ start:291 stop:1223 length:933 start_codon:yes stop_codon:yes gene_type:complete